MKITGVIVFLAIFFSCKQKDNGFSSIPERLDTTWLATIIRSSDTSYSKPYFRTDFVTASYYINRMDSTLCQVMRDSSNRVRQIITTKKNIRTFYAQYYPNGHAQAILPLDASGKYDGNAIIFYEDGDIKSKGKYRHGSYAGKWKNYDEKGKLVTEDEYDSNGQLIKTTKNN
ncbi:MAG: hypothetical protein ABUL41_01315 [Chitinophagaceae bacterium]